MKKYSILLGAAFSLFALASCQQDIFKNGEERLANGNVPFELEATVDDPTSRTVLDTDTWKLSWERTDTMTDTIYVVTTDAEWGKPYSEDKKCESIACFVYDGSKFTTESTISDGEHTFNFLYTNFSQKSYHRGAFTTNKHSSTQVFDAAAPGANLKNYDVLAAQATITTPAALAGINMVHLYTLMKVSVKNNTGSAAELKSFKMSVDGADAYLSALDTVVFDDLPKLKYKSSGSNTVTVNVSNGTIAKGESLDVYFVMRPLAGYSGNVTFEATATLTSDAGASSTHNFEKTNAVSNLTFKAGEYNTATFTLNPPEAGISEPTGKTGWYRVESESWLKAGDRVAIVAASRDTVLSIKQESNNRAGRYVGKGTDGDYKTLVSKLDSVQIIVLEAGSKEGTFAFWCDNGDTANKYLYAAASSANQLKSQDTIDDNASFTIEIADGEATVNAQGTNRSHLRYNSQYRLFSCYARTSTFYAGSEISVYKLYGSPTPVCETPEISMEDNVVTITSPGATIYYTTDGSVPTVSSTKYEGTFTISEVTTVKAIATRAHYNNSEVGEETLTPTTVVPTCATPEIASSNNSFTITCETEGATIYYATSTESLDAVGEPTTVYNGAVSYTATTYVKAIAKRSGYKNSAVAEKTLVYETPTDEPTGKTGWYRVQNSSWLKAGDRVAIVAANSDVALSTEQKTNNRGQVAIAKGTDGAFQTLTVNDDVQILVLEAGTATGSFAFKCENGNTADQYLYAASDSGNQLKSQASIDDNASFVIKVAADTASVVAEKSSNHNVMRYNEKSTLFACYVPDNTQLPLAIFKYYGEVTPVTPTCATPAIAASNNSFTISCATEGATIYYATSTTSLDAVGEPTTVYNGAVSYTATTYVKAVAKLSGYNDSAVASATCSYSGGSTGDAYWQEVTSVSEMEAGEYVIAWLQDNAYVYLPSNTQATKNPTVGTGLSVASGRISGTVSNAMIWTFTGSNAGGFTVSASSNYLNSTDASQGISVTTSASTTWTVSSNETYGIVMKGSDTGTRYLAVYTPKDGSQSWRYYSLGENYKGSLKIFKKHH